MCGACIDMKSDWTFFHSDLWPSRRIACATTLLDISMKLIVCILVYFSLSDLATYHTEATKHYARLFPKFAGIHGQMVTVIVLGGSRAFDPND